MTPARIALVPLLALALYLGVCAVRPWLAPIAPAAAGSVTAPPALAEPPPALEPLPPLSAYRATLERPLFTFNRRPETGRPR